MCLILLSWDPSAEEQLVVASNRDEFYARPSEHAHLWAGNNQILAGKDLQQLGTWLGITQKGRFAAVTNYRKPDRTQYPLSRGALTTNFLNSHISPEQYMQQVQSIQNQYAGFNLLVGDRSTLYYYSNRSDNPPQPLTAGVYGLSNHLLNTPWPKVATGIEEFSRIVKGSSCCFSEKESRLLTLLQNDTPAEESLLPETGVGMMIEKLLSPRFIRSPGYGTRASTIIQLQRNGKISFVEQNYSENGETAEKLTYYF